VRSLERAFWATALALAVSAGVAVASGPEIASCTQVSGSTDVLSGLVTQGLRGASSNPPLNLGTGAITCGTVTGSSTLGVNGAAGSGSNGSGSTVTVAGGVANGTGTSGDTLISSTFIGSSGSTPQSAYDRMRWPGKTTSLSTTTATATSLISYSTVSNHSCGGEIMGTIDVQDASNHVSAITFRLVWSASNRAGTVTSNAGTAEVVVSSTTTYTSLTTTVTAVVSGTAVLLKVTPSWSAGTPTIVQATWTSASWGLTQGTVQ
jgi:hypothetical protein